jgi:hypothetical protein
MSDQACTCGIKETQELENWRKLVKQQSLDDVETDGLHGGQKQAKTSTQAISN